MAETVTNEALAELLTGHVKWKFDQLTSAGYAYGDARLLAEAQHVDWHRALELVANGCDPRTAADILL